MNLLYYDSMGMLSSKRMIENDSDGVFVRNLINKLILIWNKINYFKQFQYSLHLSPIFQRLCRLSSYKIVIIDLRNNHVSTFFVMVESINFRVFSRLSLVTETHTREAHPDNFKTSSFPSLSTLIRLSAPPPSQNIFYLFLSLADISTLRAEKFACKTWKIIEVSLLVHDKDNFRVKLNIIFNKKELTNIKMTSEFRSMDFGWIRSKSRKQLNNRIIVIVCSLYLFLSCRITLLCAIQIQIRPKLSSHLGQWGEKAGPDLKTETTSWTFCDDKLVLMLKADSSELI